MKIISEACASTGIIYATNFHGMKPLIDFGSEEQKQRLLPCIAEGGYASLAITEPQAGSDATGMTTRFTPDGDEIVIDGAKIFITIGTVGAGGLLGVEQGVHLVARDSDELHLDVGVGLAEGGDQALVHVRHHHGVHDDLALRLSGGDDCVPAVCGFVGRFFCGLVRRFFGRFFGGLVGRFFCGFLRRLLGGGLRIVVIAACRGDEAEDEDARQ